MATRKKAAARGIRNQVASRTTNRTGVRRKHLQLIPATGPLKSILEARIQERIRAYKRKGDLFRYPVDPLLVDVEEMGSERAEDLRRLRAEDMPITERHFDMLDLHVAELAALGVVRRTGRVQRETISEDAQAAMRDVLDARLAFAKRGAANDIPLSAFDVRKSTGSPRALFRTVVEILKLMEGRLDEFDSPRRARQLFDALKTANDTLGEVSNASITLRTSGKAASARKQALLSSLYDLVLWMSRWGDAMAGGDAMAMKRWRLDNLFPGQSKLKPGVDDLVDVAVTEPGDGADPGTSDNHPG